MVIELKDVLEKLNKARGIEDEALASVEYAELSQMFQDAAADDAAKDTEIEQLRETNSELRKTNAELKLILGAKVPDKTEEPKTEEPKTEEPKTMTLQEAADLY